MKTVFKYKLETTEYQVLQIPRDGKILTVQIQQNNVVLWVLVEADKEYEDRTFIIVGIGHPIYETDKELIYIGTYQLSDGEFTRHVFEKV